MKAALKHWLQLNDCYYSISRLIHMVYVTVLCYSIIMKFWLEARNIQLVVSYHIIVIHVEKCSTRTRIKFGFTCHLSKVSSSRLEVATCFHFLSLISAVSCSSIENLVISLLHQMKQKANKPKVGERRATRNALL